MRTKLGRYLTACPVSTYATAAAGAGAATVNMGTSAGGSFFGHLAASGVGASVAADTGTGGIGGTGSASGGGGVANEYFLGIEGQGIGDTLDCFTFVPLSGASGAPNNPNTSIDVLNNAGNLPLRYGTTVALRVPAARERYLGLHKDAQKGLGFWRALIGTAEHWTLIKGRNTGHYVGAGAGAGAGSGVGSAGFGSSSALEEPGSRGQYVRQGDSILLFTGSVNGKCMCTGMWI